MIGELDAKGEGRGNQYVHGSGKLNSGADGFPVAWSLPLSALELILHKRRDASLDFGEDSSKLILGQRCRRWVPTLSANPVHVFSIALLLGKEEILNSRTINSLFAPRTTASITPKVYSRMGGARGVGQIVHRVSR